MPLEEARQQAIERYSLKGFEAEPAFDRIARLAADIFSVPIALVTVLGRERQYLRGNCGLTLAETPREVAFCDHAVRRPGVLVVRDAKLDDRFAANPLVTGEPHIRFYAGAPLRVGDDVGIGSLCVIDTRPRSFSPEDCHRLEMLALSVCDLIELRAGSLAAEARKNELERQAELLKATVENVDQGVALFGRELDLVLWNGLFFELFGFSTDLARPGIKAQDLIRMLASRGELGEGDPASIVEGLLRSVQATPSRRIEVRRNNGRVLDVRRSTLTDGRMILTAADITEQRQLSRVKDEFISTVSHELRTPLTSILGSLALIERGLGGLLSGRGVQLLGIAIQNGKRLNSLINDLLDIERLGAGIEFQMEEVELGSVVVKAVEQNRPYASGLDVGIDVFPANRPLFVRADEGRLLQALSNLLSNAAKYSPKHGSVRVRVTQRDEAACVSVSDSGPGIPAEFRPRLFQRFAQAEASASPSPKRSSSGTGGASPSKQKWTSGPRSSSKFRC